MKVQRFLPDFVTNSFIIDTDGKARRQEVTLPSFPSRFLSTNTVFLFLHLFLLDGSFLFLQWQRNKQEGNIMIKTKQREPKESRHSPFETLRNRRWRREKEQKTRQKTTNCFLCSFFRETLDQGSLLLLLYPFSSLINFIRQRCGCKEVYRRKWMKQHMRCRKETVRSRWVISTHNTHVNRNGMRFFSLDIERQTSHLASLICYVEETNSPGVCITSIPSSRRELSCKRWMFLTQVITLRSWKGKWHLDFIHFAPKKKIHSS
jgi:hypothetical protein